jgi:uncharacterized membrane protein
MTAPRSAPGPVQLLVIAFEGRTFDGRILDELRRLREYDVVRLIDLMFVAKDEQGDVVELDQADLPVKEAEASGALVGTLMGLNVFGEEGFSGGAALDGVAASRNGSMPSSDGVWFLADAIPPGTSAALALVEHRWAIPLRDAIESARGHDLVDHWIHPDDLVDGGPAES